MGIYISLIYSIMDFSEAWRKILDYARSHKYVITLVKGIRDDIVCADNDEIKVVSHEPKSEPTLRPLKREYFEMVWNILESRGSVSSDDIDPALRGRRLIILALMAWALNLRYATRPVRIYIRS